MQEQDRRGAEIISIEPGMRVDAVVCKSTENSTTTVTEGIKYMKLDANCGNSLLIKSIFFSIKYEARPFTESEGGKENCKHCGGVKSLSKRVGGSLIQGNGE